MVIFDLIYTILLPSQSLRITLHREGGLVLIREFGSAFDFAEHLEQTELSAEARLAFDRDLEVLGQANDLVITRRGRAMDEEDVKRAFGEKWSRQDSDVSHPR